MIGKQCFKLTKHDMHSWVAGSKRFFCFGIAVPYVSHYSDILAAMKEPRDMNADGVW